MGGRLFPDADARQFRIPHLLQSIGDLSVTATNKTATPAMFDNRDDAGRQLAERTAAADITADAVVSLSRDGLPVARAVADALNAPLSLFVVNEIDAPFNKDIAIGATTSNGTTWIDDTLVQRLEIGGAYIEDGKAVEQEQAADEAAQYDADTVDLSGKTVILIDDGLNTGTTARAGIKQAREDGATAVIVAVPVISPDARELVDDAADQLIAVKTPMSFISVSQYYKEFGPVPEDAVEEMLNA